MAMPIFAPADKATLQAALVNWDSDETAAATTYGAVASWDVTAIADFSSLLGNRDNFNEPLAGWDTSGVTTMNSMFHHADGVSGFNQPLAFDTNLVTDMGSMFNKAFGFNSALIEPLDRIVVTA